jgi:predicted CXXCH cytochrome family protein
MGWRGRNTGLVGSVRLLAGAAAIGAGILVVWGCTVTQRNYRVLSLFFDGVPDPSMPPGAVSRVEGGKPVVVILHKPYAEERCETCHRTRYRPTRENAAVCLECHSAVKGAHANMHGPVEANACLWCHNPHESRHPALLREEDRKVCSQCHTPSMLNTEKVPAHADAARGCLECHSGHGGDRPFFLKAGVPGGPGVQPEGK